MISVYDDRIEFTTIGGLPAGISLDDIMLGLSVCRNPKLANIFYRLQLIEAYGTGISKIMKSYEGSGKKPVIETTDNAFKIILPNINEGTASYAKEGAESEIEAEILEMIRTRGSISRREVELSADIKQTSAGRILNKMMKNNLISKRGQGKNTRYVIRD